MSKPKFLKPLLIGATGIAFVGLVTSLSINWSNTKYIQAVGSSGVKPFIESFGTSYHNAHDKLEVVVEAGGTTFAVEQVAKGYAQIGNASNNPYYTIFPSGQSWGEFADKWVNKKTFTLGWEGLAILYKVPSQLSKEAKDNFEIMISKDNILDFYAVFSGFNESKLPGGQIERWSEADAKVKNSMWHYLTNESKKHLSANDVDILLKTPIYPYLRSGGNTAANTSIAFTYYSNLVEYSDLTEKQQNAFKGGQYGHDHPFGETDEANSKAWELFYSQDRDASMTYISTGFLAYEGNRQLMKERGYKIASYLPSECGQESERVKILADDYSQLLLDKVCSDKGYNWYRPINVMIDLDNQMAKDFIYWLYTGTDEHNISLTDPQEKILCENYLKTMADRGAKPLSKEQFESMTYVLDGNNNLYGCLFNQYTSDFALYEARKETKYKEIFGAIEYEGYIPQREVGE